MRAKHTLSGHLLTASSVALIAAIVFVQAQVALRSEPSRMFSLGMRNIVFGYGTDTCSSIDLADSFEDGSISPFGTSGDASWSVTSATAYYGTYSAKAGAISSLQSTTISITRSLTSAGIVSFGRRVSSEENFDFLRFYINGVLQESWSGEVPWAEESYNLSSGSNTLTWTYSKDDDLSEGSDTAWIDMVRVGEDCGASSSSASSISATCGNSARESGEECDDGDTASGDGCSSFCTIESGYSCTVGTPDICSTTCGDGIKAGAEACDDGDTTGGDGCSASCTVESGWSCTGTEPSTCSEVCGNGIITASETCDDSNALNGDGCSSVCAEENGWSCTDEPSSCETSCGDGIVAGGEVCDDGNADNTDSCTDSCSLPTCGDGYIQDGEACDDGGESATCNANCTVAVCGDQLINATAGEACDDGNDSNEDACINTCQIAMCGDTFLRAGVEECDPPGEGTCGAQCSYVTGIGQSVSEPEDITPIRRKGPPPNCGNAVLEPEKGEVCDEGRFNGLSPTCDRWCGVTFCGDGKVHAESEECEPTQDGNGSFLIEACGGKTCTVPVCTADGTCVGGCRWVFLPACRTAAPVEEPSPVFSSDSSESIAAEVSSSSAMYNTPVSSAPAVQPVSSSSTAAASSVASANGAASSSDPVAPAAPASSTPVCGNGIVEGIEECDDGADNNNISPDSCRTDCVYARCGDGVTDTGEQCDDGNDILGDGCTPLCTRSTCGNGVLEQGEECDEGSRNTDTTPDSCSTSCLLPRCGDGVTDTAFGEACDDGERNSNTTPDACRLNCISPRCGDGVKDASEQCDDGNTNDNDSCTSSCQTVMCGNGVVDWNEACDDGNSVNGDGCSSSCLSESQSFLDWFKSSMKLPFGW